MYFFGCWIVCSSLHQSEASCFAANALFLASRDLACLRYLSSLSTRCLCCRTESVFLSETSSSQVVPFLFAAVDLVGTADPLVRKAAIEPMQFSSFR